MSYDQAFVQALSRLKSEGLLRYSELRELTGNERFERIREDLILKGYAEEVKAVALLYITSHTNNPSSGDLIHPVSNNSIALTGNSIESRLKGTRVFISYGHNDASPFAFEMAADLQSLGCQVWIDKEKIREGRWEERIEQGINESDVFISILTPHAARRPDGVCLDEISYARFENKPIVPVMLYPCKPPLCIFRLHYLDSAPSRQYAGVKQQLYRALVSRHINVEGQLIDIVTQWKPLDQDIELKRYWRNFIGREWVVSAIDEWIKDPLSKVFYIIGHPGVGKSALIAHLIAHYPQTVAYHLCSTDFPDSRDPKKFVHSMVGQLSSQFDEYLYQVHALNANFDSIKQNPIASNQFRDLVVNPLAKCNPPQQPLLILVDALDEGTEIADFLAANLKYLEHVKLVVTTRPIETLRILFEQYKPFDLSAHRAENQSDLRRYLKKVLPESVAAFSLSKSQQNQIIEHLLEYGGSNFLYVEKMVLAFQLGQIDPQKLEEFPIGLAGFYLNSFQRLFPGAEGLQQYDTYLKPLLNILLAAYEPLSPNSLALISKLTTTEIRRRMRWVESFFPLQQGVYRTFHSSVQDWIMDQNSTNFSVDVEAGHESIIITYDSENLTLYSLKHLIKHYSALLAFIPERKIWSEKLYTLITNFVFLQEKIVQVGLKELLEDFDAFYDNRALSGDQKRQLFLLRKVLLMSANGINLDAFGLSGQLVGRIDTLSHPMLTELVSQARQCVYKPSIIPLYPSLDTVDTPLYRWLDYHRGSVTDLKVSPNGRHLFSWGDSSLICRWDLRTGQLLNCLEGHTSAWPQSTVSQLVFSSNGLRFFTGAGSGNRIGMWDAQSGEHLAWLEGHGGMSISRLILSSDDSRLITMAQYGDDRIGLWDAKTGKHISWLNGQSPLSVLGGVLSPDESTLFAAERDGRIGIWSTQTGKHLKWLEEQSHNVYTPHSSTLSSITNWHNDKSVPTTKIGIWVARKGKQIRWFKGHEGTLNHILLTPDGARLLLVGSSKISLWNAQSGKIIRWLDNLNQTIFHLQLSADGVYLFLQTSVGIGIWNTQTGEFIRWLDRSASSIPFVTFLLSPDGARLCASSKYSGNHIDLWDVQTGKHLTELTGHSQTVYKLMFSSDSARIFSNCSNGYDFRIGVWDAKAGVHLGWLNGHEDKVRVMVLTPDGSRIISSCGKYGTDPIRDSRIGMWDAKFDFNSTQGQKKKKYIGRVTRHLLLSKDAKRLFAQVEEGIRMYDPQTGKSLILLDNSNSAWRQLVFSADGTQLIGVGYDYTNLWNAQTGMLTRRLKISLEVSKLGKVYISPNINTLVAISAIKVPSSFDFTRKSYKDDTQEGKFGIWNLITGKFLRWGEGHLDGRITVQYSGDGKRLFSFSVYNSSKWPSPSYEDKRIGMWDGLTGEHLGWLEGHKEFIRALSLSPDGSLLVSQSHDRVGIWEADTGRHLSWLIADESNELFIKSCSTFSSDSSQLLCELGNRFVIWNIRSIDKQLIWLDFEKQSINKVFFHTTNNNIFIVINEHSLKSKYGSDRKLRFSKQLGIWDSKTGTNLEWLEGHTYPISSLTLSLDASILVSCAYDGIGIWNAYTGRNLGWIQGEFGTLSTIKIAPDNSLVCFSYGKTIVVCKLFQTHLIRYFKLDHAVTYLYYLADQHQIICGDEVGNIHFLTYSQE